jgi:hypothetical protein
MQSVTNPSRRNALVRFPEQVSDADALSIMENVRKRQTMNIEEALQRARAMRAFNPAMPDDTPMCLDLRDSPAIEWPSLLFDFVSFAVFEDHCEKIAIYRPKAGT